jgi:hypothetical protein
MRAQEMQRLADDMRDKDANAMILRATLRSDRRAGEEKLLEFHEPIRIEAAGVAPDKDVALAIQLRNLADVAHARLDEIVIVMPTHAAHPVADLEIVIESYVHTATSRQFRTRYTLLWFRVT